MKIKCMLEKYRFFFSIGLSCFCIYTLSYGNIIQGNAMVASSSFIAVFFFIVFVGLFYFSFKVITKRKFICSVWVSFILACCTIIGAEFSMNQTIVWAEAGKYFSIAGLMFFFIAALVLFFHYLPECIFRIQSSAVNKMLEKHMMCRKKTFLFFFTIIFFCWIFAFLALYPGNYSYDATPQVHQIFKDYQLSAHHPVVHTLMLNGCLFLGEYFFYSYNTGVAIYSIIQAVIMALVFSYCCYFMLKYCIPKLLIIAALLFFSLNPIIQIFVFTTTKDTIFSGMFLMVILYSLDILIKANNFREVSKKTWIIYCSFVVLMCLFRNQGIYVFAVSSIFMVLFSKRYWKKCLIVCLICIVSIKIILGPLSNIFNVEKGDMREMLSIPMQQVARVVNLQQDRLTNEELQVINEVIPLDKMKYYIPQVSDPIKSYFNTEKLKENPLKYVGLWLKLGWKNLEIYIDAFLYLSYGYWYVDATPYWNNYILVDGSFMEPELNTLNISRTSLFPSYEMYLRSIGFELQQNRIPILSIILNQAFPFWLFLIYMTTQIYKKRYILCIPFVSFFVYWVTLLVGPVIGVRYALPLIVCVPLMSSLIFLGKKKRWE